jgi:hypothetical protein
MFVIIEDKNFPMKNLTLWFSQLQEILIPKVFREGKSFITHKVEQRIKEANKVMVNQWLFIHLKKPKNHIVHLQKELNSNHQFNKLINKWKNID